MNHAPLTCPKCKADWTQAEEDMQACLTCGYSDFDDEDMEALNDDAEFLFE